MEANMADKLGPLSDGSPRDASKMGSNSHVYLYVALVLAAIVIGFALYWFSMA
jgi:multisubunit Na+/H+ antiporter MnhC subunit